MLAVPVVMSASPLDLEASHIASAATAQAAKQAEGCAVHKALKAL